MIAGPGKNWGPDYSIEPLRHSDQPSKMPGLIDVSKHLPWLRRACALLLAERELDSLRKELRSSKEGEASLAEAKKLLEQAAHSGKESAIRSRP